MLLYVNGSTHTMAAEAVTPYTVANDDLALAHLGKLPHPANLSVSWGKMLSIALRAGFQCGALVDNTVDKIIDDTIAWSNSQHQDSIVIIEWADIISDDEDKIWQFHKKLDNQNIKHIFFNSNTSCSDYSYDWNYAYISPTGVDGTYERRLQIANIETVSPNSKHYGRDGHVFWNRFLLNYIITHDFI
jgi:hypothetical protein